MVADFERGDNINNLGGGMGSASDNPNDHLRETYIDIQRGGKAARLEYSIEDWSAFWLKLRMLDLTPYRQLKFDIRADAPVPFSIKVELHRVCTTEGDVTTCEEIEYTRVYEISEEWEPMTVDLSDFVPAGWPGVSDLSSWQDMQELVFAFELRYSGSSGVVYLDNIKFCE
jgi:hypothetical protein